ncbi:hypothetical protein THAOC_00398 [Thalassiosira oceanica]|uniref:Uncharacterized protein n=1 Tax=Thalassiosira oceanica TaxID=159749 RepID=K0TJC2_THAOC|nr:hypothetical protein THAOC_00398 [Thalassiosira oceanica]|eukprot:EJK77750.1 hypothetical protein THAOC_00398 [Thalassiosira oceanica]
MTNGTFTRFRSCSLGLPVSGTCPDEGQLYRIRGQIGLRKDDDEQNRLPRATTTATREREAASPASLSKEQQSHKVCTIHCPNSTSEERKATNDVRSVKRPNIRRGELPRPHPRDRRDSELVRARLHPEEPHAAVRVVRAIAGKDRRAERHDDPPLRPPLRPADRDHQGPARPGARPDRPVRLPRPPPPPRRHGLPVLGPRRPTPRRQTPRRMPREGPRREDTAHPRLRRRLRALRGALRSPRQVPAVARRRQGARPVRRVRPPRGLRRDERAGARDPVRGRPAGGEDAPVPGEEARRGGVRQETAAGRGRPRDGRLDDLNDGRRAGRRLRRDEGGPAPDGRDPQEGEPRGALRGGVARQEEAEQLRRHEDSVHACREGGVLCLLQLDRPFKVRGNLSARIPMLPSKVGETSRGSPTHSINLNIIPSKYARQPSKVGETSRGAKSNSFYQSNIIPSKYARNNKGANDRRRQSSGGEKPSRGD